MKKNLNKLATLALTGILMTGMSFGALATGGVSQNVIDNKIDFEKELGVWNLSDKTAAVTVPNVKYTYNVTPDEAGTTADVGGKSYEVKAGVGSRDAAGSTEFKNNKEDNADAASDHVVKHRVELDLSFVVGNGGVKEPGIYRYVVTEIPELNSEEESYDYVDDTTDPKNELNYNVRYLDVYVGYDDDGTTLKVLSTVMFKSKTNDKVDATSKSEGYEVTKDKLGNLNPTLDVTTESVYKTYDLILKKQISGNMASSTQEFQFKVDLDKAPNGVVFATSDGNSLTAVKENKSSTDNFGLKGGETLTIKSVPVDVEYEFTETLDDAAGYTVTNGTNVTELTDDELKNGREYETEGKTSAVTKMSSNGNENKVYFLNKKSNLTPTGVVMDIAPYAAMILGAGAFAGMFLGKRKTEDKE